MFPPKAENRQKRQKFKLPYFENRLELEVEILHGIIFHNKDQNTKVSKKHLRGYESHLEDSFKKWLLTKHGTLYDLT